MINGFEFAINIFDVLITVMFLTLYLGCKYNDWKKYIGFVGTVIIGTIWITLLNVIVFYNGILEKSVFILIYFAYTLLFLQGNVWKKLFISAFTNCALDIISSLSMIVAGMFLGNIQQITDMVTLSSERVIFVLLTKLLQALLFALLLRFKFDNILKGKNIILLTVMSIAIDISMTGVMNTFLANSSLGGELILADFGIAAAAVLAFYTFIKINLEAKTKEEMVSIKQKYESDKMYAKYAKEFYDKTCGIRHDLENHLLTALSLIRSDKPKEAEIYIQELMKNQIEPMTGYIHTDNETFNAIANNKLSICEKLKIKPILRIMNNSMDCLTPDEIGILFGNLFDNAIKAAKQSAEKSILLEIQKQGDYLSIFMSNSIISSVITDNSKLETTKTDKELHGYGTKNIRRIVESHGGIIEYFEENGKFCCDILI